MRKPISLNQFNHVFFIGIKGVAMANLAVALKKIGKRVSGSDLKDEQITDIELKKNNINFVEGFAPEKIPADVDLIVYSAAHLGTKNPQLLAAQKDGKRIISQAEMIDLLMATAKNRIAICGCHGKTTTSSLLAYCLIQLGKKPSYIVGAPQFNNYWGGESQDKQFFVIEADEYGVNPPIDKTAKFLLLSPNFIICNNIDFDHPDVYKDIEQTKTVFLKFFYKLLRFHEDRPRLIACYDNLNLREVLKQLPRKAYLTFGFSAKADLFISEVSNNSQLTSFKLRYQGHDLGQFQIKLFGKKNVSNAAGVILMLIQFGFPIEKIKRIVIGFQGARRRFEEVYFKNNINFLDDYAHHPEEIRTTILAARERFKTRRIIIIFQPHTFSRTKSLLHDFVNSLSLADISLLAPIFASAREKKENFEISSERIQKEAEKKGYFNVQSQPSNQEILNWMKKNLQSDDVVFTMGAGNIYKLKKEIVAIIDQIKKPLTIPASKQNEKKLYFALEKRLVRGRLEFNKGISHCLSCKIKTTAQFFFEAKTRDDLIRAIKACQEMKLKLTFIGGGSNFAIISDRIGGLVVKNNYISKQKIKEDKNYVYYSISSGYPVMKLINELIEEKLSGLEYHYGLPGSVGGAIYMNSKWTRPWSYFSDSLVEATLVDAKGTEKKVKHSYFHFGYDFSQLQKTKEMILEAVFKFKKESGELIKKRAQEVMAYRQKTQPQGVFSSGCFFKNIPEKQKIRLNLPTVSAGYLIDKAGLKSLKVGGFYISQKHANFIINDGSGRPTELKHMLDLIKEKVRKKYGVELESEVVVV